MKLKIRNAAASALAAEIGQATAARDRRTVMRFDGGDPEMARPGIKWTNRQKTCGQLLAPPDVD